MPSSAATASPGTEYSPTGMLTPIDCMPIAAIAGPPKMMRLRESVMSTACSTSIFRALQAISPNITMDTPPITGSGIVPTNAPNLGQNPPTMNAATAAYQNTWVE